MKREPKYLARVRQLPCCMCGAWPPNEAHHMTGGGMGLKTNDRSTMSLCITCHSDFHRLSGRFKGWTKEQLRMWQIEQVQKTLEVLHDAG